MNPQGNNVAARKVFLEQKLRESGEEARLEEYLRQKLIESGWKDDLKKQCKGNWRSPPLMLFLSFLYKSIDIIRKKGLEKVTVDDLVDELIIKGRATVPVKIKEDLLARIKGYFEEEALLQFDNHCNLYFAIYKYTHTQALTFQH
eukprot:TRINITY_DN4741_c0_g3_i4.p2 TRINITY_DN4741_c0_g3~~TRINITY_DN4741_c0_g3_i4.p2  ORF type:complete len:145 (-),score=26.35 TRINITY_DN4741_c0_g3_i4:221-655(-)